MLPINLQDIFLKYNFSTTERVGTEIDSYSSYLVGAMAYIALHDNGDLSFTIEDVTSDTFILDPFYTTDDDKMLEVMTKYLSVHEVLEL